MTAILRMGTMSGSLELSQYYPEIKLPVNYIDDWQTMVMSKLSIEDCGQVLVFRCKGASHFDKNMYIYDFVGISRR